MYKEKTFLAIIPARGGSERLPKKNILPLMKKPLIEWTIEAGLGSNYIDRVVVSSDDEEILSIAEEQGVTTISRPDHLSNSKSKTTEVISHVLDSIADQFDYFVILQPTSPLRHSAHIDEAIELILHKNANAVVSISESKHSPLWCNTLPNDGLMNDFIPDSAKGKRSQDLEKYYRLNGAIYIVYTKCFNSSNSLMPKDTYAYLMKQEESIDIDTKYDFLCAEAIMKCKKI